MVIFPGLFCSVADKDPVSGAFLPPIFFPDLGSRILNTFQIQDFTFKNGEKQEKLNFV
jgi:hypothetical protein